ncbi:MAG: OmpP1/FadL family transporter, partial [Flavisolibacter sp.]
MKSFLFIALSILGLQTLHAQEPADALRYSWYVPGGSARVKAIGGAMGSLGGDLTATFVNPAGLAFYKTGDFVISPAYQFGKTRANYLGNNENASNNRFNWGTTGFVIGGGDGQGNVRNSALSIAYNRTADFNSNFMYRGLNNQSSYSQKYLEEIQRNNIRDGNTLSSDYPFGSSLAFNTYLIDTVGGSTNGNFQFQSRAANLLSSGLIQENMVTSSGGIDELALGLAVNVKDKWMFGGSVGIPILHYKRTTNFLEADATDNENNQFNYGEVHEELSTTGVGFNIKAGMIFKPTEFWRLGLAIHSPTFFGLTDKTEAWVSADVESPQGILTDYSVDYTGGEASEFRYSYLTPYRVMGSISYVLREIQDVTKQRGFLTADVEYVNYKASSFKPNEEAGAVVSTQEYLDKLNDAIDNAYKGAFNFRAGGELKFTTIMVRLGAA